MSEFLFYAPEDAAPVVAPVVDETQPIDHVPAALDRIVHHLRNRPERRYEKLIEALIEPMQAAEDALWLLIGSYVLADANAYTLDLIGAIVGETRGVTATDDEYRIILRTKILVLRSSGTIPQVYAIARLAINDPAAAILLDNQGTAAYAVIVDGVAIGDTTAANLIRFLRLATAAGVRPLLEYTTSTDALAFTLAVSAFSSAAIAIGGGVTVITVDSTEGFPASGSLVLDPGLAIQETVTYTGKTGTTFTGVSARASAHNSTPVEVQWSASPGLGLGDSTTPATGGNLASVLE